MKDLISTLRHRSLRLLLSAGLISLTGDKILSIGLAYSVFAMTGSTMVRAGMLLTAFLPQILLGSVAGVFVDRWSLKKTMIITNLLLAGGLAPLLLVNGTGRIWIVYLVMIFESCVAQFFSPAEQAVLPLLVSEEELLTSNALNGQNSNIARLAGGALGGIVAAAGGITALALVDMASFLVATVLITGLRPPARAAVAVAVARDTAAGRLKDLVDEWRDGLAVLRRNRVLRVLTTFLVVTAIGEGVMGTLFVPFVRTVLHGSAEAYGLISGVQAIGGIAGGMLIATVGGRLDPKRAFAWGAVAFGAIDLVMFLYPLAWHAIWPAGACMILVGVPGALVVAGETTLLQRYSSEANRGRIFGAVGALQGAATVLGTVTAGLIGQRGGIVAMLSVQGAGYVVGGLLLLVTLRLPVSTPGIDETAAGAPASEATVADGTAVAAGVLSAEGVPVMEFLPVAPAGAGDGVPAPREATAGETVPVPQG